MELFMTGISYTAKKNEIKIRIANILHGPEYAHFSTLPLNLEIYLFPDNRRKLHAHSGLGALTLPSIAVGLQFLGQFGGQFPRQNIFVGGKTIRFEASKSPPKQDILGNVTRLPYLDPRAIEEKEKRSERLDVDQTYISSVQFGWECRDGVFSREWQKDVPEGSKIKFDDDKREFRVVFDKSSIVIKIPQIGWTAAGFSDSIPIVQFSLFSAPTFEEDIIGRPPAPVRTRISWFDTEHERVAPYASLALRFVCIRPMYLDSFRSLCRVAKIQPPLEDIPPLSSRNLFSISAVETFNRWLRYLPFEVAFQLEAITRKLFLDLTEILSLREELDTLVESDGNKYLCGLLQSFSGVLKGAYNEGYMPESSSKLRQLFRRCKKDYVPETTPLVQLSLEDSFECLHVSLTPTTMVLDGPFPERSNRVFRRYPKNHSSFLRVTFVDETNLQYRFDREVDGASFVRRRVGSALRDGILIGGRKFKFLAYSQSALKEHAVWFMKPFYDQNRRLVTTHSIIESLGNFGVAYDPQLIYCPGKYGARISQAFTSTDSSISVEPEEIFQLPDIKVLKDPNNPSGGSWVFTDGVGTISAELAKEIHKALRDKRKRARRARTYPRCYQVRFMGCKGMLSVDYKLKGRAIGIRPSMTKFDAPQLTQIDIARAFDRPSPFYLNRPLIMVLEGLGVPYETFKILQDAAVREAVDASKDLERAARMLETFGLGTSYRLSSIMLHLHKLGVRMPKDHFYQNMMEFATNHVLRELKHHARIPMPGWTLVGVVDVHDYLDEDEIFACVQTYDGKKTYLEGRVVVTRSPVIHPGDILVVNAIGPPPRGSPFEMESLANSIVFPTKGSRPLPSMAGGGDCDGDTFNITYLSELPVTKVHPPAEYKDAPKKLLPHPCTMEDVGDFVVDYINSDVLGLIAINWLIIADQSEKGIFDPDCLTLSQLHSDAVDYPKSSTAVPLSKIPRLKFKAKPDWNRPETIGGGSANFYESQHAIGKLFRAITLPAIDKVQRVSRHQRKHLREEGEDSLVDRLENLSLENLTDEVDHAVYKRISEFIDPSVDEEYLIHVSEVFDKYASQFGSISSSNTLSYSREIMLTEEEVAVGTIVARSSQPRRRKDLMSKIREHSGLLVKAIRTDLAGDDDTTRHETLYRAWTCWRLATTEKDTFGARSLGLIALGTMFDTMKAIEDEEMNWL